MSRNVPIETSLGCFYGRDCIFLDVVKFRDRTNTLLLEGEINGNLCTVKHADENIPYVLHFRGVLALKMVELDSCDWPHVSSFDEVLDSEWVSSLGGNVTPNHRHFCVQTYDDVFEVICESYEFKIQKAAAW